MTHPGYDALLVLAVAVVMAVVYLVGAGIGRYQDRRRPELPEVLAERIAEQDRERCSCEDCADLAEEFAQLVKELADLDAAGERLRDLYLIPGGGADA